MPTLELILGAWNTFSLSVMDFLLGWLLRLPSDVVLFTVAIGTAGLLTFVRLFTTNQERLGRVAQDTRRLGELIREAKARKDKEALQRLNATKSMVAMLKMRAEGWPLLVAILPIALLATWALLRLEFHPPRGGETVTVAAEPPVSAAGEVMHLVPVDGLEAENGWVQPVTAVPDSVPPRGEATWKVRGAARAEPYELTFRRKGYTYTRELLVGQRVYSPPLDECRPADGAPPLLTKLELAPNKLFGVVPGLGNALPAWLVAYLLIAVPFVFLIKWLLRIY